MNIAMCPRAYGAAIDRTNARVPAVAGCDLTSPRRAVLPESLLWGRTGSPTCAVDDAGCGIREMSSRPEGADSAGDVNRGAMSKLMTNSRPRTKLARHAACSAGCGTTFRGSLRDF